MFADEMRRLWHLPWLLCSLIGSLLILRFWTPLVLIVTGLAVFLLGAVVASHVAATIVGAFLLNRYWRRLGIVLLLAMHPALLLLVTQLPEAYYLRYQAVYNRFRDNLIAPIPKSVSDLEFISLSEGLECHLMFRFTISPEE